MLPQIQRLMRITFGTCAALVVCGAGLGSLLAQSAAPNTYIVHNLVSDLPGIADHQDPNLVNPWGNGFGTSPFWIGNNGTGTSTLYDGTGAASALVVKIPAAGGASTPGPVTGVIFNLFSSNTAAFNVAAGKPGVFLFCSEDGVISGWNPGVDGTHAKVLADRSATGAVYKGCALGGTSAAPLLFAANFNSGAVDVFDGALNLVVNPSAFHDQAVPAGFAPFNVQTLGGKVYVAYAKQNDQKHDDVAGIGNGYIAVYDMSGGLLANLVSQGPLNSPWGFALAPSSFGTFSGALLVSNFGDGKINAFDPATGRALGFLMDTTGNPIAIPGLWSINFGSGVRNEDTGTLYFTAGIGGGPNNGPLESHGLLGSIQAPASFLTTGVVNGASFLAGPIAPNTWTTIKGSGLSTTNAIWQVPGNTLPTTVNGVSVTVNGEPAPLSFVISMQINFLVPADIQPGTTVKIQVTNNGLPGATVSAPVTPLAPAFFIIGTNSANGNGYIAATHADGSLIAPAGFFKTATTTGAKPGETIVMYGTGFGATTPAIPNGQVVTAPLMLPVTPTVVIDGYPAMVQFAGLTGVGLYQFNVVVPAGVATGGDVLVVALLGNGETQANAFLTIAAQ